MRFLLLETWLLLLVVAKTAAQSAGVKAVITSSGLEYASEQIGISLSDIIRRDADVPSQAASSGMASYSLSNIRVSQHNNLQSRMRFVQGQGLEWTVSMETMTMVANFSYNLRLFGMTISERGLLTTAMSNLTMTKTLLLGRDQAGRPTLRAGRCRAGVTQVRLTVTGEQARLARTLQSLLQGLVRDFVEQQVCVWVAKELEEGARRELAKVPMSIRVFDHFEVDLSLTQSPRVSATYVETFHKGVFSPVGGALGSELPQPPSLPPQEPGGRMLYLGVSQASLASLLAAAHSRGSLHYQLLSSSSTAGTEDFLTISKAWPSVGTLFPELGERYPGRRTAVRGWSAEVPQVSLQSGELTLQAAAFIALTLDPPVSQQPLLQLRLRLQARLSMAISRGAVVVRVEHVDRPNVTVVSSSFAKLPANNADSNANMEEMAHFFIQHYAIPEFNRQTSENVRLPVPDNIDLVNPQLSLEQGAILVATDLRYRRPLQQAGTRAG